MVDMSKDWLVRVGDEKRLTTFRLSELELKEYVQLPLEQIIPDAFKKLEALFSFKLKVSLRKLDGFRVREGVNPKVQVPYSPTISLFELAKHEANEAGVMVTETTPDASVIFTPSLMK